MEKYNVVIVGGGITGSALAYELAKYTDIKNIAVVEKYGEIGGLNSSSKSNSQTIHSGDIETNYTLEKALQTKTTADMVVKYCLKNKYENDIIFSYQKMAMGVGDKEVEFIKKRYELFSQHFTSAKLWSKADLKNIEPNVILNSDGSDRDENIIAMGSQDEWTTVDYGKMSASFISNAKSVNGKKVDLFLNSPVSDINPQEDGGYEVCLPSQKIYADFVIVNSGAYSLHFAHKMGYGMEYGCLPVSGSFYMTNKKILNGKVYMVQNDKLPFAALHGDPDITMDGLTRLGPTALMSFKLERHRKNSLIDLWTTARPDFNFMSIIFDMIKDKDVRDFIVRNMIYEIPIINRRHFTKHARKIIPSLKYQDVKYANGFGGIRPQVLDKKNKKMLLGEASIDTNKGIIFNMTPSPGATSCLGNGMKDTKKIATYLGKTFYSDKFKEDLLD